MIYRKIYWQYGGPVTSDKALRSNTLHIQQENLEHFQAKWTPVRR
jgi:hypothetical protein